MKSYFLFGGRGTRGAGCNNTLPKKRIDRELRVLNAEPPRVHGDLAGPPVQLESLFQSHWDCTAAAQGPCQLNLPES